MDSFPRQDFPNISLTFGQFSGISITAVKDPDISKFCKQVATLYRLMTGKNNADTLKTGATNPGTPQFKSTCIN